MITENDTTHIPYIANCVAMYYQVAMHYYGDKLTLFVMHTYSHIKTILHHMYVCTPSSHNYYACSYVGMIVKICGVYVCIRISICTCVSQNLLIICQETFELIM